MRLYVDDLRKCPEGWKLARTITDAIRYLYQGYVEEVSLDHDICFLRGTDIRMHKESYMPVAMFMTLLPPERRPKKVRIHTANVDAGWAMEDMLSKAGYTDITVIPLGDDVTQEDVASIKKEL